MIWPFVLAFLRKQKMSNIDVEKIKIFGSFLGLNSKKKPQTGKKCLILVKSEQENLTKADLKKALTLSVDGPTKPEVLWSTVADDEPEINERTLIAYFVPIKAGKHKLTVRCNGKKISAAPFEYQVEGEDLDVSKILEKVCNDTTPTIDVINFNVIGYGTWKGLRTRQGICT